MVIEDDIGADITPRLIRYAKLLWSMDCRATVAESLANQISVELYNADALERSSQLNKLLYDYLMFHVHRQRSFLIQKLGVTDQICAFLHHKKSQLRKQTFSQSESENNDSNNSNPNESFLVTRASRAAHGNPTNASVSTACVFKMGGSEVSSVASGNSRQSRRRHTAAAPQSTAQCSSPCDEGSKYKSSEFSENVFSPNKLQLKKELKRKDSAVSCTSQATADKRKSKITSSLLNLTKKKLEFSEIEDPWSGVCPACNQSDMGGGADKMVACDLCDQWYHFDCVGYYQPPDKKKVKKQKSIFDEVIQEDGNNWYCPKCISSNLIPSKESLQ